MAKMQHSERPIVENMDIHLSIIVESDRHVSSSLVVLLELAQKKTLMNRISIWGNSSYYKPWLTAMKILLCVGWDWLRIIYIQ